jgi:hypothetical protein
MSADRRWRLYVALTAVTLLGLAGWSWSRLAGTEDDAGRAAEDLAACRQLADHVTALSRQPLLAGTREWAPTELTRRIERAARDARMDPSCLVRISPEDARKVGGGDGSYREQPTQLQLRQVSVPQLATFLHVLTATGGDESAGGGGGGLRVSALRLSAPRGREGETAAGDLWSVEATLTYLIYDPSGPTRKGT